MSNPLTNLTPEKRLLLQKRLQQKGGGLASQGDDTIPPREPALSEVEGAVTPPPLSVNQEGLWFLHQLAPDEPNFNVPGTVRVTGRLNLPALQQSLDTIFARHEILRTTFRTGPDGTPAQIIHPPAARPLIRIDLTALPAGAREPEAIRQILARGYAPFDLSRGPLFLPILFTLSETEFVFSILVHHIICDGWSMGVFQKELMALYSAFSTGLPAALPDLPIQYADYAVWERLPRHAEDRLKRLAYWRGQLGGHSPLINLPLDHPRPSVQSYRGRHTLIQIDGDLSSALRSRARAEGVTLYMLLLTAFKMFIHAITGQDDLTIGAGIANRDRSELEALIGFFVRVLPLRTSLSGNPAFRQLLAQVRETVLEANTHHLPLAYLVKELSPPRDPSRPPFFQIEFTLLTPDKNPALFAPIVTGVEESIRLHDLTLSAVPVEGGIARFDLAIFLWDMPAGLTGAVEYCADLFEEATIAKLISQFKSVLQFIHDQPETRLNEVARLIQDAEAQVQGQQRQLAQAAVREKFSIIKRKPRG